MREFLRHNLLLKVVSVVLAVVLWFHVVEEERSEISLSIPLEVTGVPPDRIITGTLPEAIHVRVSGPKRILRGLDEDAPPHTVDLAGAQPGTMFVDILPESLRLPGGVRVVSISPETLRLTVESRAEKELPVFPSMEGRPAEGHVVRSVSFEPQAVRIRGPASVLDGMHAVWTKPLSLEGKRESFRLEVELDIRNPSISVVSQEPIVAEVAIEETPVSRTFKGLPIQALNAPPDYSLNPDRVDVTVTGPVRILEQAVSEGRVSARVDFHGLTPGRYLKQVFVKIPEGVDLKSVSPSLIELIVGAGRNGQRGE